MGEVTGTPGLPLATPLVASVFVRLGRLTVIEYATQRAVALPNYEPIRRST